MNNTCKVKKKNNQKKKWNNLNLKLKFQIKEPVDLNSWHSKNMNKLIKN